MTVYVHAGGERHGCASQTEMSPDSVLFLRGGVQGDVCRVCGGVSPPRRKIQQPVGDARSKPGKAVSFRSAVGGLASSSVGAAEEAEQRALEEGFGGQSRCGKRLGGEDVGMRKRVLGARACLRLLLRSVC